jgi:lathosterol oxidase
MRMKSYKIPTDPYRVKQRGETKESMDVVLHFADEFILDGLYAQTVPESWGFGDRGDVKRQALSLFAITAFYGFIFYFSFASLSFHFLYDKQQMKHPKFLKNQVGQL